MLRFRVPCLAALLLALPALPTLPAEEPTTVEEAQPDNSGPVKLVAASLLGGSLDDEIVAADIAPDKTIVLAGNTVDLKPAGAPETLLGPAGQLAEAAPPAGAKKWLHPSTFGFLLRLGLDGTTVKSYSRFGYGMATLRKLKLDARGGLYVLGEAPAEVTLAGATGKGPFIAALSPDAGRVLSCRFLPDAADFAVDANGDLVVLAGARLLRFAPGAAEPKWTVTWKAYGGNHPGAMALSPETGITAVVGYGMTHTGREPWKDPYAYGFDRDGKQVWALWNPDPKREVAAQFGGNGLMADTTGNGAAVGRDGKLFFTLFADGGNTVCMRAPDDPDKPLDPAVMEGVFQKTAGYGFKGASKTAVIFRVDPATGKLEKGTWMCAWLSRARANGLGMNAAAADEAGRVFVVGGSAYGCPTKEPWFAGNDAGYHGGGYLAVFDKEFRMLKCGYFQTTGITCVGYRDGYVVIGGSARKPEGADPAKLDRLQLLNPLQKSWAGGRDAFFAVLRVERE